MKKLLTLMMVVMVSLTSFAQKDVTKFLGIPVDGTVASMKQKLMAKGFVPKKDGTTECFYGEFNGTDVYIYIGTNNNKVYRIMVCDVNARNEADIKTRFNILVDQFKNNKRYASVEDYTIPEDEKISYKMIVDKKNYNALFYQLPDWQKVDTLAFREKVHQEMLEKYTEEQLKEPTEEISKAATDAAAKIGIELMSKKPVWFRIVESYGEYYIAMFYDNEYNHANGEDL